jgi:mannose-6-phosphate isomerase-like protein (cupin superfamily)
MPPEPSRSPIVLAPGEGRRYAMGSLAAVFKADEAETAAGYAVSEWWMEPGFAGVGAHSHAANDEVFYVLDGAPELLVGDAWTTLGRGGFVRVPAGVMHDFRNPTAGRAGLLNLFIPGGFEREMPGIVDWFARNPG